jgi:hypothetical protein
MTARRQGGIRPWLLAAVAMLLLVILIVVRAQQQSAAPSPGPAPAPALMAAADPPGALMMAKSVCEGQARIARKAARAGSIAADEARAGEKLYTETQAAVDELLAALQSGMAPSAPGDSQAAVEARWTAAAAAMAAFMAWNAHVKLPQYFAADPLNEAFANLGPWLDQLKNRPGPLTAATAGIRASARFADWAALGD